MLPYVPYLGLAVTIIFTITFFIGMQESKEPIEEKREEEFREN